MNDITQKSAEDSRPDAPAIQTISYCLDQIYADQAHKFSDYVVEGLTFEELIGALLQGRDLAEQEE